MSEYVFLYRGGDRPTAPSPEARQQSMQKWMAWFKDLAAGDHLIERGQPLEQYGKTVQPGSKAVVDGPFAETKDIVGGFSIIKADSFEQACELAKGCPFLDVCGSVEVRPIMPMDI